MHGACASKLMKLGLPQEMDKQTRDFGFDNGLVRDQKEFVFPISC